MFGIGMQEIILILVIGLLVIGPKKLPEVARALGKGYAEFRRAFDDMRTTIEHDLRKDDMGRDLLNLYPPAPESPPPTSPPDSPPPVRPAPPGAALPSSPHVPPAAAEERESAGDDAGPSPGNHGVAG